MTPGGGCLPKEGVAEHPPRGDVGSRKEVIARMDDVREVHMPKEGTKRVVTADDSPQENEEYVNLKCADEPLPSMYEAMDALVPFVLNRCGISKGFGSGLTIRTVQFVQRPEGESIKVTAEKKLSDGALLVLKSPQKAIDDDSTTRQICKRIKKEAVRWAEGERLQGDLLADGKSEGDDATATAAGGK